MKVSYVNKVDSISHNKAWTHLLIEGCWFCCGAFKKILLLNVTF